MQTKTMWRCSSGRKGENLQVNEQGCKSNCAIAKLVYVYEGIEKEHPKRRRHHLVNAHYFSGVYAGESGNAALWDEVYITWKIFMT